MEKIEKIKNFFMGFLTFICVLLLTIFFILFPMKKVSEKYLKEEKIKQIINDIDFVDIFINENINSEHFKEIKDKLSDSGIPMEITNDFIQTEPVKKYTGNILSKSIDNALNNKEEQLVKEGDVFTFLQDNISNISYELQEKNVPHSELLTEERQQEFLNKVKDKVPDIENKINQLQDKIKDELKKHGYNKKIDTSLRIIRIIYGTIMDMIFVSLITIFIIGIVITRKSIYKSLKWIGISLNISAIILILMPKIISKSFKYIDKTPKTFSVYIKNALKSMANILKDNGIIYLIIGILLIIINIIVYIIIEKRQFKELNSNVEIKQINKK